MSVQDSLLSPRIELEASDEGGGKFAGLKTNVTLFLSNEWDRASEDCSEGDLKVGFLLPRASGMRDLGCRVKATSGLEESF